MPPPANNLLWDGFLELDAGIHSGIASLLLPKNQAAFATNVSFRGGFPSNRPVHRKLKIAADIDEILQAAFAQGMFQSATNFIPYGGIESLAASIAGRLFIVTPDNSGNAGGSEITIPNDPNPAAITQGWMWQAERWLIVQDGLSTPIFYDGVSSRRSLVNSLLQGTTAADFNTPPVGGSVAITLTTPYDGPVNTTMRLDKVDADGNVTESVYYYVSKVNGSTSQYQVTLKNLTAPAAQTVAGGAQLIIQPANLGYVQSVSNYHPAKFDVYNGYQQARVTIVLSWNAPASVVKNSQVSIAGNVWIVSGIEQTATNTTLKLRGGGGGSHPVFLPSPQQNQNVMQVGNTSPNTIVGVTNSSFVTPTIGAEITLNLTSQFFQNPDTILFINNYQYQVIGSQVTPPTPSTNVTAVNLNDSDTGSTVSVGSKFYNLPELPAGRMGAYGMGRVWQSGVDGFSFIAGDLSGGSSGSPIYQGKDAVLKVTENKYLAGGGAFTVPGNSGDIRAMLFTATLDVSLGQGPLQVFTSKAIFSCQSPVDRTTWQSITNPILTQSLIGAGCAGQNAVINSNADILFRSANKAVRSLNLARRDFYRWGDTPIDYEILRILRAEDETLMPTCSIIEFDNRMITTCYPTLGSHGTYWSGLIALNFDQIGGVNQKTGLYYEGAWTGLNILQLVKFSTVNRSFAFVHNIATDKLEIYELLLTGAALYDNDSDPVEWSFESPLLFYKIAGKSVFDLVQLQNGEVFISDIQPGETVKVTVEYRPDFSECWFPWHSFTVCNDSASTASLYGSRLGLGEPEAGACNSVNDTPTDVGRWFQVRVTISGHCVFNGLRCAANLQPEQKFAEPVCDDD